MSLCCVGNDSKGQKFFVIRVAFVCGLLFYANLIVFNLISVPMFFNDIVAYAALGVAVVLTVNNVEDCY